MALLLVAAWLGIDWPSGRAQPAAPAVAGLAWRRRVPHALRGVAGHRGAAGAGVVARVAAGPFPCAVAPARRVRLAPIRRRPCWRFCVLSRATVGAWFVTGGFFVAENIAHAPAADGAARVGLVGAARADELRPLASVGAGGPRHARVSRPCVATAAPDGYSARARRARRPCRGTRSTRGTRSGSATWCRSSPSSAWASAVVGLAAGTLAPFVAAASPGGADPVGAGAARPEGRDGARSAVGPRRTARLARPSWPPTCEQHWDGETMLASMGSLAHYMQELSRAGLRHPRLPARGQRRHLGAPRSSDPAAHVGVDAHGGASRGRRHARRAGASTSPDSWRGSRALPRAAASRSTGADERASEAEPERREDPEPAAEVDLGRRGSPRVRSPSRPAASAPSPPRSATLATSGPARRRARPGRPSCRSSTNDSPEDAVRPTRADELARLAVAPEVGGARRTPM